MKRNLVFLLTGFLAISSVSAGIPSYQTMAAEADGSSEYIQQAQFSFLVMDENQIILGQDSAYSLTEGETRVIDVYWDDLPEDTLPSYKWTSESPDIVSITEDGTLTALSYGTGRIFLSVTGDTQIETAEYMIKVNEAENRDVEEAEGIKETEAIEEVTAEEIIEAEVVEEVTAEEIKEAEVIEEAKETEQAEDVEETEETEETDAVMETEEATETVTVEEAEETKEVSDLEAEIVEEFPTKEVPELVVTSEHEIPDETIVTEVSVATANAQAKVAVSNKKATTIQTGWIKDGDQYRYYGKDGVALTGWQTIGSYRYYFDSETKARVTGIQEIDGKLYVFSVLGRQYKGPRFLKTSQGNCFVNSDGTLLKGWRRYYSNWYYFQDNGLMKTGKLILNGKTYFLNQDGIRQTGWYKTQLYTYYLNKDGIAVTGWRTIDGKRYFFTHNGVMKTGWYKTSGHIYYLGPKGNQLTGFRTIDGAKYYLIKDGTVTKGWKRISRKWYYFKSCKAQTGWLQLGSKRYYLDENGIMVTGNTTIDGISYRFNSKGVLISSTNSYHNTEEFIACIAPLVQKYAPKYGVKVCSPIIAQAILESASGESSLGKKYNNFFGLKCGTLWTGPSVNLLTGEEYTAGHYTTITAAFRVYDNMEEGVKGYFEFLFRNRTRYNNLIGETDPYRYLEKIKADGYATSSHYVVNTYNVLKSYNLTRFDKK